MTSIDIVDLIQAAMWHRYLLQTHALQWSLGAAAMAYLAYLVIRDLHRASYARRVHRRVQGLFGA